jgi:hypothetical protein
MLDLDCDAHSLDVPSLDDRSELPSQARLRRRAGRELPERAVRLRTLLEHPEASPRSSCWEMRHTRRRSRKNAVREAGTRRAA